MKKGWMIGLGIAVIVLLVGASRYNSLVRAEEGVAKTWADVESTYQRRADLIPNLVETVKGYATHEQEVLQGVVEARARVGQVTISAESLTPEAIQRFQQAQQGLSGALSRLFAVAEAYPDLKANQNFLDLQTQLEGTENRINVARNRFNEAARVYNTAIRSFPNNLFAAVFGFQAKPYFQADQGAEKAPQVKF